MSAPQRGYLMPVGGAEDKTTRRIILNHFVQLSGGEQARLVVIPSASAFADDLGQSYCRIFTELGAAAVDCLNIQNRRQANAPELLPLFQKATGVFMTGGDQVKLVTLLGGTLIAEMLSCRYLEGMNIAGTSAGASAMSRHMIAFGRSGGTPSQRMVQLAPGLALTDRFIVDQHFRQRDRLGRLMTAVAFNPAMIGVGIDEDTAFVIAPDDTYQVIGSGSVTVVDGREMEYTNIHSVPRHNPISVVGMKVHMLTNGDRLHQLNYRVG
jgi:cyanophycinase